MKIEFVKLAQWVVIIILVTYLIKLKLFTKPEVIYQQSYETVEKFVPISFKIEPKLDFDIKPLFITRYQVDTVKVDSFIVQKEYIYLKMDGDSIKLHNQFLSNFPNSPKLIQLDLSKESLTLALFNSNGQSYSEEFPLDLVNFKYRYNPQGLSASKVKNWKFDILAGYRIRPLVNFHDLEIKLVHKTTNFNYVGGFNMHYYPSLNSQGITPFVGLEYKIF